MPLCAWPPGGPNLAVDPRGKSREEQNLFLPRQPLLSGELQELLMFFDHVLSTPSKCLKVTGA